MGEHVPKAKQTTLKVYNQTLLLEQRHFNIRHHNKNIIVGWVKSWDSFDILRSSVVALKQFKAWPEGHGLISQIWFNKIKIPQLEKQQNSKSSSERLKHDFETQFWVFALH